MTRSLVTAFLDFGLSLMAVGGALARWQTGQRDDPPALVPDDAISSAHPSYSFDPTDDRALAAYATDIFIGRVLGQTGAIGAPTSAPGQTLPQTQFAVDVLHTLKGDAAGVVTVNQVGGIDAQARQILLLAGDRLLRPGASELFLVFYVPA